MSIAEFRSSSGSATYHVEIHPVSALLSCDCRGWTMKRPGKPRHCRHTKAVEDDMGLVLEERDGQMFVLADHGPVDRALHPALNVVESSVAPAGFIQPMLASKMPEGRTASSFASGWTLEEKYDGVRIVAKVSSGGEVNAWSRLANQRTLPRQVEAALAKMPIGTYDGELVVPGRRSSDVAAGMNRGTEVYVMFDLLVCLGRLVMEEEQQVRRELLTEAFEAHDGTGWLQLSRQWKPTDKVVEGIWARGGEGAMIKRKASAYRPGWRSPDWIKVKAVATAKLTLTGYKAGEGGPCSALRLIDSEGHETTVKTRGQALLAEIMKNPNSMIGRGVVITFQQRTDSGSYRHPQFDHWAGEGE